MMHSLRGAFPVFLTGSLAEVLTTFLAAAFAGAFVTTFLSAAFAGAFAAAFTFDLTGVFAIVTPLIINN
jgi:hypothetical protein